MLIFLIILLGLNYFYVGGGNFIVSLLAWPLMVFFVIFTGGALVGIILAIGIVAALSALSFLASAGIVDGARPQARHFRNLVSQRINPLPVRSAGNEDVEAFRPS
ncbi:hypothetical protein J5289_21385 [Rhizobium sp. B230/85]|uniref:hypothetical protein n=1 Tax=unclassified Rhizobium TaxID=2613769 RepID=UPI001ADD0FF9|nr:MULTISPECIES: hypothetical protein [unclassified Rhizobium]MBO9136973.1 hypothetical protein [Rhizobium sp. B209b/85]QXZ99054.1 hypothetical protein J5289_21385 [Rhizobium sp. B230/85]